MDKRPSILDMDTTGWVPQVTKPVTKAPESTGTGFTLKLMYNDKDELLFVTKNPNEQSIIKEPWYSDIAYAKYKHFGSPEELSQAKISAITGGSPKWNSRVTG